MIEIKELNTVEGGCPIWIEW